jgi:hypothetical protein
MITGMRWDSEMVANYKLLFRGSGCSNEGWCKKLSINTENESNTSSGGTPVFLSSPGLYFPVLTVAK